MTTTAPTDRPAERSAFWTFMFHTPMRDVIRGRLDRRRSHRHLIAAADLPQPVADLLTRCVKRTRLWRLEKAAVAEELISHFADGLDAGASAEELVASFGDVRQAAKLIRRAKKRNRPAAVRSMIRSLQLIGVLLILYVGYGVYFFTQTASPSVDYLQRLNAQSTAAPTEDRAWPVYRSGLMLLEDLPKFERWSRTPRPGEAGWQEVTAFLDRQQEALGIIRGAAVIPAFGYFVSHTVAPEDRELWPGDWPEEESEDDGSIRHSLLSVKLPYLSEMRRATKVLALDVQRAAAEGDGDTVVADTRTMLGMARHVREHPIIINDLVGFSNAQLAINAVADVLVTHPQSLTDEHLNQLAHIFAAGDDLFTVRLSGERMTFEDIVQRTYTDDGDGDGRITADGLEAMLRIGSGSGFDRAIGLEGGLSDVGKVLLAPGARLIIASRREVSSAYNRLMDRVEIESRLPLWETGSSELEAQITEWKVGKISRVKYMLPAMLMPALGRVHINAERAIFQRDAVLVALALELHHRRQGAWPENLDLLTPELLPEVPPDRFDGQPMRYALIDGEPVLYSIGYDRDDDGGRPPIYSATGLPNHEGAMRWLPLDDMVRGQPVDKEGYDGDWILFPRPVEPLIDYGPQDEDENETG
ncbi:MAG: hypothetical protein JSV91_04675 [Phycisphaerales bacterium]|nr:MAG: hypothetical protein JSV91_04675 [Phycisphaerales bacterium]